MDPETKTRSYAHSAYGAPAQQRPNVRILTDAKARRVLFAEPGGGDGAGVGGPVRATGVEAEVAGERRTFAAAREVILAAGVYNTPKLLELSGVGGAALLQRLGVPVRVDLPGAGETLQDHLMTGISYEVADGVVTADPLMRQEPEALARAQERYAESRAGPLTIGGVQSFAFMPTPADDGDNEDAAALAAALPPPGESEHSDAVRAILTDPRGSSAAWFMFLAQTNLHEGAASFAGTQLLPGNYASLGCAQSHPFSRGATHAASAADPDAPPRIDPRYLSHPADLEVLARHVRALDARLRTAAPLAAFFKPNGRRNHPDAFAVGDLDGAKKYVLDTATTAYHACGSAAMLPRDKGGVVDPRLVVYGTENLRVVDASVFPLIPRGNILSSVYAVAEKAADIIKGR